MANNQVIFNGKTLIDLSSDTITADKILSGYTAHSKDGSIITGTLNIQVFRTGSSKPSDSIGNEGDLFFITEG